MSTKDNFFSKTFASEEIDEKRVCVLALKFDRHCWETETIKASESRCTEGCPSITFRPMLISARENLYVIAVRH